MSADKGQKRAGEFLAVLGLSDYGIQLLDAYGRWDIVTNSHIPFLRFLISPLVAPGLLFAGMLLYARAKESIRNKEIESQPLKIVGPDSRPLPAIKPKREWWKPVLLVIPAAAIALVCFFTSVWFYDPGQPPLPQPPQVADVKYNEPIVYRNPSVITKQTFVENQGSIGTLNQNGNTMVGEANGSKTVAVKVEGNFGGTLSFNGATICNGSVWECLLVYADKNSGDVDAITHTAGIVGLKFEDALNKITNGPETQKLACHDAITTALQLLIDHASDEHSTVKYLRSNRPWCIVANPAKPKKSGSR